MESAATDKQQIDNVTGELANFASQLTLDQLPDTAITVAKQCFLDWLGVTLAGAQEPLTVILHATMDAEGLGDRATLIGRQAKGSACQAALVNGGAGHALDYDDVVRALRGHPTAPVAPAVLALSERDGLSGADLLLGLATGIEIEARIGAFMGDSHYLTGWHATGTTGTFGAAAGCAKLLNLDPDATALAFGIAGTQAAGLKSMFGTMCKPLHAGKAASNGLLAAELARRGFTANADVLGCKQGYGLVMSEAPDPDAALDGLGKDFHLPNLLFKYHAACYGTHAPIEAALKLRANPAFDSDAVEKVEVHVAERLIGMCDIPEPLTGLEVKFSLAMTVALALAGEDTSSLEVYSEETARRPDLVSLRDKITVGAKPSMGPNQTEVIVHQSDGTVLRETDDRAIPNRDLDAQWSKLWTKFQALATPLIGEAATSAVLGWVEGFETQPGLDELCGAIAACKG